MADSAFRICVDHRDGVCIIMLSGELDMSCTDILDDVLDTFPWDGQRCVIIDLRDLAFMDSTGLHALLDAKRRAEAAGTRLIVTPGRQNVQRVFEVMGITQIFAWATPTISAA